MRVPVCLSYNLRDFCYLEPSAPVLVVGESVGKMVQEPRLHAVLQRRTTFSPPLQAGPCQRPLERKGLGDGEAYLVASVGPSLLPPAACFGSPFPSAGPGTDDSFLWWGQSVTRDPGVDRVVEKGREVVDGEGPAWPSGTGHKGLLSSCDFEKLAEPEHLG